jgi:DNA-binding LytR/AlgR family response regulator
MELIIVIYAYRFIISRLRGEASVISVGENSLELHRPERFLVRKIGKEFIIRVKDIDWIEAAGNYMNLNLDSRSYPLRETMAGLESKLDPTQFVRIHRSTMVNLNKVASINPLDSGDYEVTLSYGKVLRLSRRYRDNLKQQLN